MKYNVTVHSTVIETYLVEAENEADAREKYYAGEYDKLLDEDSYDYSVEKVEKYFCGHCAPCLNNDISLCEEHETL